MPIILGEDEAPRRPIALAPLHGPASLPRSIGLDDDRIAARGCRRVQAGPTTTPTDVRDGEAQPGRGFEKCGCVCSPRRRGDGAATIWPCRGTLRHGLQQSQRPLLLSFRDMLVTTAWAPQRRIERAEDAFRSLQTST